jgi:hypothetical protein
MYSCHLPNEAHDPPVYQKVTDKSKKTKSLSTHKTQNSF